MGTQMFWGENIGRRPHVPDGFKWKQSLIFDGVSPGYPVEVFLSIMEHQMAMKFIKTDQQRLSFAIPYINPVQLDPKVWINLKKEETWLGFKNALSDGVKGRGSETNILRCQVDLVKALDKDVFEDPQVYSLTI